MVAAESEGGERLDQAIAEYLEATERGGPLDRRAFCERYPDLAQDLEEMFQVFDRFASLRPPPAIPVAGQHVLGKYTLLQVIGRGGMGVVYKARQTSLERLVAVKICRVQSPDEQRRIAAEARSAADLHHAHIVEVYEVGCEDGYHYIAMRYVDGPSLAARIAESPLPPRQAADCVRSVAEAIHYAHRHSTLHRDIKPANIVLDSDGRPHVTDFGLAKRIRADGELTATGDVVGTPAYMSPEQATAGRVGPASDIYSLGALLYALLTGRPPFQAHHIVVTLRQVVEQDPVPPSRINSQVPRDLETICLKCLRKEPSRRYDSASSLADDLGRFLRHEPILARRTPPLEQALRWCRRNRLLATSLLATLVLAALGVMAVVRQRVAHIEALLAREARAEIEVRSWQAQALERLRDPTGDRGDAARLILSRAAAPRKLLGDTPIARQLDLQTKSILVATWAVPRLEVERSPELPEKANQIWTAAIHPDGRQLAVGTARGPVIWVCGARQFTAPVHADDENSCRGIYYTPQGTYLLVARSQGGLELWDGQGRTCLEKWQSLEPVLDLGFPDEERHVWVCSSAGRVYRLTLPQFQVQADWPMEGHALPLTAARFSRSCELLATGDAKGEVHILNAVDWRRLASAVTSRIEVQALAWSPDADQLAVGVRGGSLKLYAWDGQGLVPGHRLQVQTSDVRHVHYSPDGTWLLAGHGGSMRAWDAATGEPMLTSDVTPLGFSQDVRHLVAATRSFVARCRWRSPSVVRSLSGHRGGVEGLAWSADSRHLVTLDTDFECRVWRVESRRAVDAFGVPPGDTYYAHNAHVAISADGRQAAYASGGLSESRVVLRDVVARIDLATWKLSGGFEQLAGADGRFLLVREQDRQAGDKVVETAVWEFSARQPPRQLRVLRSPEPADGLRFFSHMLAPGGRFYLWVGPREPHQERIGSGVFPGKRIEVWDVARATPNPRFRLMLDEVLGEPSALLSPDGRYVWTTTETAQQGIQTLRHDLTDGTREVVPRSPSAVSPDGRTVLQAWEDDVVPTTSLVVAEGDSPPWLRLLVAGASRPAFSPDGRYLAWGNDQGQVLVLDIAAARAIIEASAREPGRRTRRRN